MVFFCRVPTDSGLCCSLNTGQVLAKSRYAELVRKNQGASSNGRTVKIGAEGMMNGLRLVLDLHSNKVSFGTLEQDFNAFSVFLARPDDFPYMRKNSLKMSPGQEHFLSISGSVVTAADIRSLPIEARRCRFPEEGNLSLYSRYTAANCRFECLMRWLFQISMYLD